MRKRELKKKLSEILKSDEWQSKFEEFIDSEDSNITSILSSLAYDTDLLLRWRAISAFSILAKSYDDIEKTRILIRRCIWNLTEEAGAVGWGSPEIIGVLISDNRKLAEEYTSILVSYTDEREDGPENFLEHTELRKGVIWAIAAVAERHPDLVLKEENVILQRFKIEEEAEILIQLCRIAAFCKMEKTIEYIIKLFPDQREADVYIQNELRKLSVSDIGHRTMCFI